MISTSGEKTGRLEEISVPSCTIQFSALKKITWLYDIFLALA